MGKHPWQTAEVTRRPKPAKIISNRHVSETLDIMIRIALSGLLLLIPAGVLGQPSSAPSFEVASVKLHIFQPGAFGFGPGPGGNGANIRISGNRVTIGQSTFTRLVMSAYKVKDFQIAGVAGDPGP
jgi:hypothetical protein